MIDCSVDPRNDAVKQCVLSILPEAGIKTLASQLSVSERQVFRLLKGERNPSAGTVRRMIRAGRKSRTRLSKAMYPMMILPCALLMYGEGGRLASFKEASNRSYFENDISIEVAKIDGGGESSLGTPVKKSKIA